MSVNHLNVPMPGHPPVFSSSIPDVRLQAAWFEPSVHSTYFQLAGQWVSTPGVDGLRSFVGQARLLPLTDFLPWLEGVGASHNPRLGQSMGLSIPATAHGSMGMAALTSPTLSVALDTIARYLPLRSRMFHCKSVASHCSVTLMLAPRLDLGDCAAFLANVTLFSMLNVVRAMAGDEALGAVRLLLPGPPPQGHLPASLSALGAVEYGSPCPALRVGRELAQQALHSADHNLHLRLCRAGDEELSKLSGSMGAKVRHLLHSGQPQWPTLVEIAEAVGLSRRTVIRRLEEEGLTYRLLLAETRNELAKWYLRHTRLSLGEIADKVGFSDPGNFHRAFRRDECLTPRDYRKRFI